MTSHPRLAAAAAPTTTTPTQTPEMSVEPNGRVQGIDGLLDQVAAAAVRQARTEILPVLLRDRELQATVGRAAGRELAKPLWILTGAVVVYAGWRMWQSSAARSRGRTKTAPGRPTRRRS